MSLVTQVLNYTLVAAAELLRTIWEYQKMYRPVQVELEHRGWQNQELGAGQVMVSICLLVVLLVVDMAAVVVEE